MDDFLRFFHDKVINYKMTMEICYSNIVDWCISIWRRGRGENGEDLKIVDVQDCDMELCFAKAHVQLKEWLFRNEGGY